MFLLVFVVLLGTAVNSVPDQPYVEVFIEDTDVGRMLLCRVRGFNTSDIILNIKKNHCVQTKEDGVETTGVRQQDDIYWREDHVIISGSDMSHYSCEVSHAASRFRVEKGWDPEYGAKGRIISSKFIDTTPPEVKMFPEDSKVQTNIILRCLASGFYPNNITAIMKRNGRNLTREDGVESSGVCSNKDGTFQRRDSVEIKKSDQSNYSCEVIHDASGSRVEKFSHHSPPPPPPPPSDGDKTSVVMMAALVLIMLLILVLLFVLKRRLIYGAAARSRPVKYKVPGQPKVEMTTKYPSDIRKIILVCVVKDFSSEDIILNIKRNGRVLTAKNGVMSSGVVETDDGVLYRKDHVEVLKADVSHYSCEIIHAASGFHVQRFWTLQTMATQLAPES